MPDRPGVTTAIDVEVTHVVMHERPIGGLGALIPATLYRPLLVQRNRVAMRRLRRLVDRHPPPASNEA